MKEGGGGGGGGEGGPEPPCPNGHANRMQDQPISWCLGPLAWSLQVFAGRAASTSLMTRLTQGCRAER